MLGHGTIGSGVVEVLQTNAAVIAKRVGEDIAVKYILDLRDFPGDPNADKVVHDYDIIDVLPDSSLQSHFAAELHKEQSTRNCLSLKI